MCDGPKTETDHVSGYCSDACLQTDMAGIDDRPPVLILARDKAGGFGCDLHWQTLEGVYLLKIEPKGK